MPLSEPLACVISALIIGAGTETLARALNLWRYHRPSTPILNVLIMFSLLQGGLIAAGIGHSQSLLAITPVLIMAGGLLGLAYEAINLFRLKAWYFPPTTLTFLGSPIDKAVVIGAAWGFVPVLTLLGARLLIAQGAALHAG